MKSRRVILICGLIVVGVVIVSLINYRSEPRYNGRSLSSWLQAYYRVPDGDPQVTEAMEHIGTNAIPFLLRRLQHRTPAWMLKLDPIFARLPNRIGLWWAKSVKGVDQQADALIGFRLLGPKAAFAAQPLISMLDDTNHAAIAIDALSFIGKPALPQLLVVLTNRAVPIAPRSQVADAISGMGPDASSAVGPVLAYLEEDDSIAFMIFARLEKMAGEDPAQLVPELVKTSHSSLPWLRSLAVQHLGGLGETARPGIPDLKERLGDPDTSVRMDATNALKQIAPHEF